MHYWVMQGWYIDSWSKGSKARIGTICIIINSCYFIVDVIFLIRFIVCKWLINYMVYHCQKYDSILWCKMGCMVLSVCQSVLKTLRPRQNGCHFPEGIFLNWNVWILIKISLEFIPKGPINNIPALVQIMAWHWIGDQTLSEPMMA